MFQHIENLRRKSEAEKRRFVFLFAVGVTLVIASFWLVSFVMKVKSGTLSFDLETPRTDGKGFGQQIEESWEEFFPSVPPAVTPAEDAPVSQEEEASPEVMLGEPESVEQGPVYPADVYSN